MAAATTNWYRITVTLDDTTRTATLDVMNLTANGTVVDLNGASNTKNEIGGYSIVQAESHDAAAKLFGKDHPHLQMPGAWIEIVEIMPMPGM